ncbi:hypothetical protein, partial [Polyangium sorediatum]|nr:hypothetical protein [Polyangium sorediatum]
MPGRPGCGAWARGSYVVRRGVLVRCAAGIGTPGRPCHTSMPVFGGDDGRGGTEDGVSEGLRGGGTDDAGAVRAGGGALGGGVRPGPGAGERVVAGGGAVGLDGPC